MQEPKSSSPPSRSPSRSRQKPPQSEPQPHQAYIRKTNLNNPLQPVLPYRQNNLFPSNTDHENETTQQREKKQIKKELLRSFLRIEQLREEPIDKFVKIVWIYKGKFGFDERVGDIMAQPRKYLERLSVGELGRMGELCEGHRKYEQLQQSPYAQYWKTLSSLIHHLTTPKSPQTLPLQPQYQQRINQILQKPLPQLLKLQKQATIILKTQAFGSASSQQYWEQVLRQIKVRRLELVLGGFYREWSGSGGAGELERVGDGGGEVGEPVSPVLVAFGSVNPKLIVQEQVELQQRKTLSKKIYQQQFQKGKQKLLVNLSLPHNHSLLSTEIITEQTSTYDQITKQIIQFEKYKRMQEDQQEFNDWVPCQTEGRFRDQKPVYINRVRVACEWNKYNSMHYSQDNPPPKTIQGYKFNIFYPDLYDKQKTPQYYLQNTDDPNYCVIKFKAGPPYKDVAFKILKKQWDITEKSGFQSIFARGILHLYFNFKKPRFRI